MVQKASEDGMSIPAISGKHVLPEDFVEEALLLSDILDLNEISAVELLLAGEQQMSRYLSFSPCLFFCLSVGLSLYLSLSLSLIFCTT